jgi:hypothetical protein
MYFPVPPRREEGPPSEAPVDNAPSLTLRQHLKAGLRDGKIAVALFAALLFVLGLGSSGSYAGLPSTSTAPFSAKNVPFALLLMVIGTVVGGLPVFVVGALFGAAVASWKRARRRN